MTRAVIRVVQLGDLLLVRIFQHCSAPPLQSRVALLPKLWLMLFITTMSAMIVPSERYRWPKISRSGPSLNVTRMADINHQPDVDHLKINAGKYLQIPGLFRPTYRQASRRVNAASTMGPETRTVPFVE